MESLSCFKAFWVTNHILVSMQVCLRRLRRISSKVRPGSRRNLLNMPAPKTRKSISLHCGWSTCVRSYALLAHKRGILPSAFLKLVMQHMEHGGLSEIGGGAAEAGEDELELPPGFRFHPTDEELITHYLSKKILDAGFDARAIAEVDLNKCEPWDLPQRAKLGEKEWYFFCIRDRKYPTGLRTNRATDAGYWKATGKDREIRREKSLVGMKKTLVFYGGRAPKGEKTNWVMHEYRLEDCSCSVYSHAGAAAKNEWVICRVFKKGSAGNGKKAFGMVKMTSFSTPSYGEELFREPPYLLPPLTDSHVTCFSNSPFQLAAALNPSAGISSLLFSKSMPSPVFPGGDGGFMSLLEGDGLSPSKQGSRETVLTADMNSDQFSDNEIGRNSFEGCLWNC